MGLVEFELEPLDEVEPWGEPNALSLSWFGFSSGRYRMQVGEEFLLNYSDSVVAAFEKQCPNAYCGPLVDYQVVRLWEDLIRLTPEVLEPVPADLLALSKLSCRQWQEWHTAIESCAQTDEETEAVRDVSFWFEQHGLDTGYLSPSSWINFWRVGEEVVVRWDNSDRTFEGVRAWSSLRGEFAMTCTEFLAEVRDFNDRFIAAMADRVDTICGGWARPDVRVDLAQLRREHSQRALWVDTELSRPPAGVSGERAVRALGVLCKRLPLP